MAGNAAVRGGTREGGLDEAIRAAGGVGELARRIGVAQPSVSAWKRIPAERVAAVAEATGLPRATLRPDLFLDPRGSAFADPAAGGDQDSERESSADPIDQARAREYALLARLVLRAPDPVLLRALSQLRGDATPLGLARIALAGTAQEALATGQGVDAEFFAVFIGVGRGEVLPYASFYRTGFLHERPLAEIRAVMEELGLERADGVAEPEDHLGSVCEIMAGLADGALGEAEVGRQFFVRHVEPWAARAFADIENAPSARFYRAVGAYGRAFVEIESEAFALPL